MHVLADPDLSALKPGLQIREWVRQFQAVSFHVNLDNHYNPSRNKPAGQPPLDDPSLNPDSLSSWLYVLSGCQLS